MKPWSFWEEAKPAVLVKKKRKCLGRSSDCKKVILTDQTTRLCSPCKHSIGYFKDEDKPNQKD